MSLDFRIVDYNYPFQDNVELTATSSSASFPVNNLTDYIRAKEWRSSGNFTITDSNKYIDFKESSGGAEATATLTTGDYTSTTLATEIKTRIEAVSPNARTYTISYSSTTGKWSITGETYLDILFSSGTNASNSVGASIGYASSDYTGAVTYTSANTAIHTHEAIEIDLKSTEEIDTVALLFDLDGGSNLTSSAVVKIQANATPEWSSPAVDVTLSFDNTYGIYTHYFTTDQSYRYWRVYIADPSNTDLYVAIGKIILGKGTTLSRSIDIGFALTWNDYSQITSNDFGHQYVDLYPVRKELTFNYNVLSYADIQTLEGIFLRNKQAVPVFCALDGVEDIYDKDHFVIYGRLNKKFTNNHLFIGYFKAGLSVEEIG
jgi:hypothetical protein